MVCHSAQECSLLGSRETASRTTTPSDSLDWCIAAFRGALSIDARTAVLMVLGNLHTPWIRVSQSFNFIPFQDRVLILSLETVFRLLTTMCGRMERSTRIRNNSNGACHFGLLGKPLHASSPPQSRPRSSSCSMAVTIKCKNLLCAVKTVCANIMV